ncbi:MAG TPA: hypothetical protein VNZ52_03475, partial [Candidatus Thermoplasmatota archaeon]|nr:hypothetical protein [Candidatus Thermoplasmatota archaeon]
YPPTQIVAYCGSGVTASLGILAMEVAGLPGVALYPGSRIHSLHDPGYSATPGRPATSMARIPREAVTPEPQ